MTTLKSTQITVVGIDVSKSKLDVYCLGIHKFLHLENTAEGLKKGIAFLKKHRFSGMIVLESTGGYEKLAHAKFVKAGFKVHIAHPKRVYHFAQQKGRYAKTDRLDAKTIAEYGEQESVEESQKPDQKLELREELCTRRAQLVEHLKAEKCRLKDHLPKAIIASIKRSIKQSEKEIEKIEALLKESIETDEVSAKKVKCLKTYKGVGDHSAYAFAAFLPELGQVNRREIACLSGLAPRNHDSGQKSGKRSIRGGRAYVRKILYMVALSAITHNPVMKKYYKQLKDRGKPSLVALTAVMRKTIVILNAMLRDEKAWQFQESS